MRFYKRLFLFSLTLSIGLPAPLFAATFDPNYLISDEEMQNWQSMNREDIQAFLAEKGSYIANLQLPDKDGVERPVSDIIHRAAVDNKINPKYVLVKLQKEQSLISEDNPTQKQLDWATGYGVCDSCSMDDPAIQKHKGFGTQVDSAAGIMRWYYDNVNSQNWIKRPASVYLIDSTPVTPANYATAFLYTYTPHINGNKNFWKLWQEWFDQVYPDGSLVKSIDSPDVYLIQDREKRRFTSMTALTTRFDPKLILAVPQSELARYSEGKEISLPNFSIVFDGSTYYLLDYDYKHQFANADVLRQIGYNPDEIITVDPTDLTFYTTGTVIQGETSAPLGRIIEARDSKNLYFVDAGEMHPIFDPAILKINFPHLQLEKLSVEQIAQLNATFSTPVLLKDGTLFGIKGYNEIYVVEKGKKRHIASEEVFNGLGFNWKNIVWVNEYMGMAHETAEPIYLKSPASTIPPSTVVSAPKSVKGIKEVASDESITTTVPPSQTQKPVDSLIRTPQNHIAYVGEKFVTPVESYVVADYDSGSILASKNIDFIRPLASLSKLMTAQVLVDNNSSLTGSITYTPSRHKSNYHNYSIAEGDKLSVKDIFYSMLVASNNTASVMLVDSLGYTMSGFSDLMNAKAQSLGLASMSFVESYGFDPRNQGSPRDVVSLFRENLKNDTISAALGISSFSYDELSSTDDIATHIENSSNLLFKRGDLPYTILASKTGFTYEAGASLIMLIERPGDGKKFILLTMGNPDFGADSRFNEPARFATWALNTF